MMAEGKLFVLKHVKKCFFRNVVETEYYYSQADKNNILP